MNVSKFASVELREFAAGLGTVGARGLGGSKLSIVGLILGALR